MRRITHGSTHTPSDKTTEQVLAELGKVVDEYHFPEATKPAEHPRFIYMFGDLAKNNKCLIPQTDDTLNHLSNLGAAMRDTQFAPAFDSEIPSAYTYLAQLINHDINFTDVVKDNGDTDFQFLASANLEPWSDESISKRVSNKRAGMLELDCLYGRMQADVLPPRQMDNRDKMALGTVSPSGDRPAGTDKDDFHDLVRGERSETFNHDRTALIGDRRNDSNLIVSQLQVAFLRAHNAIIDAKKCSYQEAKQFLVKHYHWLILHDFLPKIVPGEIIEKVENAPLYNAKQGLPFEFSIGAFRFGHCMVRRNYYYNDNFRGVKFPFLATVVALSKGGFKPTPNEGPSNLPENRIIEWENFLDGPGNKARALRTEMVEPLFELLDEVNINVPGERSLAVQDLKRGYLMRIPTGQVIAEYLKVNRLTPADLEELSTPEQFKVLKTANMLECTPLSFYVLAEAKKAGNGKLGEVGGRIVAEVLIGLLRDRPDSIIGSNFEPDRALSKQGTFFLSDLLKLAGVFGD